MRIQKLFLVGAVTLMATGALGGCKQNKVVEISNLLADECIILTTDGRTMRAFGPRESRKIPYCKGVDHPITIGDPIIPETKTTLPEETLSACIKKMGSEYSLLPENTVRVKEENSRGYRLFGGCPPRVITVSAVTEGYSVASISEGAELTENEKAVFDRITVCIKKAIKTRELVQ